jgi:hypothetical protein
MNAAGRVVVSNLKMAGVLALCGWFLGACAESTRAADVVFQQQEVLGYDWPRHLLTYDVEFKSGQARTDAMSLRDAEGAAVPFQVSDGERHGDGSIRKAKVSFYAALPADGELRYVLSTMATRDARPSLGVKPVTVNAAGNGAVTMSNAYTAVRLPAGRSNLAKPIPLAKAPGPVQAFRLANGQWIGGSKFLAEDAPDTTAVRSYQTKVLASGPLFAEAAVRYELVGGGHYEATVRLQAEEPMIFVSEEADTGLISSPVVSVEYLLSSPAKAGWQPDIVYTRNGRPLPESDAGLEAALTGAGIELPEARKGLQRVAALRSTDTVTKLFNLNVAHRWTESPMYAGLLRRADLKASAERRPFVAVIPLHAGRWRNGQYEEGLELQQIVQLPNQQVAFRAPLTAPARRDSYLHTGEYDTTLPASMVRRVWCIMTGPAPTSMQALWDMRLNHGYVSLDDYKDWILDWRADPKVTYPRLFFTTDDVKRARQNADSNPYKEQLLALPYFSDDPAVAQQLAEKATKGGRFAGRGYAWQLMFRGGYMGLPWISGFHQANYAIRVTIPAEQALSNKNLDPALRDKMRAVLAACAYAASEPDVTRRGCGVHQGNPNMPIRRFLALPQLAALIPDHPRAKEWLDVSAQFMRWKLQTMVGPKGDWGEPGRYLNASLPYFIQAAIILENAGVLDDETARQCGAVAYAHSNFLSPPDPRFDGARIVPSLGHGSQIDYYYAFANAVLLRNQEPEKTRQLMWVWNEMGRPDDKNHRGGKREGYDLYPLLLPMFGHLAADQKADAAGTDILHSRWRPGWGAVMRSHAGDPNETFMAYRQGYMVSHADPNQGDFVIHAKGAPLTPSSRAHYLLHNTGRGDWGGPDGLYATKSDHFCRIRFGRPDLYGGQPGGGIESNANEFWAGESIDYVRGWGDYADTNRWTTPKSQWAPDDPNGPIRWDRQVMFLKGKTAAGPNYFVFRDSFCGNTDQNKYWHLRSAVKPERIARSKHGFEVQTDKGTRLSATFLSPKEIQPAVISGRDGDTVCSVTQVKAGPQDMEYFVVLYPRLANERVPAYRELAPGVLETKTSEGTDYIFLGGEHTLQYESDDLAFSGRAGTVRVRSDGVHFVLATADGDGSVSYKGMTHTGPAPFDVLVPKAKLKTGTIQMPSPRYGINATSPKLMQEGEDIVFEGPSGGVEVLNGGFARLVLGPGRGKVGYRDFAVWGEGPFDLILDETGVHGVTEGRERMIYMNRPTTIQGIPALWIDGVSSAPGYSGDLAIPVLSGRHEISIRTAEQPDLFE